MRTYSRYVKTYSETPAELTEVYKVSYSSELLLMFHIIVLLPITVSPLIQGAFYSNKTDSSKPKQDR